MWTSQIKNAISKAGKFVASDMKKAKEDDDDAADDRKQQQAKPTETAVAVNTDPEDYEDDENGKEKEERFRGELLELVGKETESFVFE
jgi:hypothetical protein